MAKRKASCVSCAAQECSEGPGFAQCAHCTRCIRDACLRKRRTIAKTKLKSPPTVEKPKPLKKGSSRKEWMEANQIRPWLRSSSAVMPRCLSELLGSSYVSYVNMKERQAKVDDAWKMYKKRNFFRGSEEQYKRESETYPVRAIEYAKALKAKCLRRICGIKPSYISRVSNNTVLKMAEKRPLSERLLAKQLHMYKRMASMSDTNYVRQMVFQPSLYTAPS